MTHIEFFASGEPKGQPRARAFARKMGNKFVARMYDAGTAEGWKQQIVSAAAIHRPADIIQGAVGLYLKFIFPRPKKHHKSNDSTKPLRPDAPAWHTAKPDNDNLQKAVMDCLTQFGGFWRDDAQVARVSSSKVYGVHPGCVVMISPLETETT